MTMNFNSNERYITQIIEEGNTTSLVDSCEKIWCKLSYNNNECSFVLFPSNIPSNYIYPQDEICAQDRVEFSILCDSRADAESCVKEISMLIFGLYKEKFGFSFPMDIGDIVKIFSGKQMHYKCIDWQNDEQAQCSASSIPQGKTIFVFTRSKYFIAESCLFMRAFQYLDFCEDLWIQAFDDPDLTNDIHFVNVWYN